MSNKTVKTATKKLAKKTGKVICAWCDAELGKKKGIEGVSHGICESCRKAAVKEKPKKKMPEFLIPVEVEEKAREVFSRAEPGHDGLRRLLSYYGPMVRHMVQTRNWPNCPV